MGGNQSVMTVLAPVLGFIADLLFGDPHFALHPVRLIGWLIGRGERLLRRENGGVADYYSGALLAIFTVGITFIIPFYLLKLLYGVHFLLGLAAEAAICYQVFAARALRDESMKVYSALNNGDLPGARQSLSFIVGRDTDILDEEQIVKAAVETVSENTSDGVIAPMLYLIIGGAPLGLAYKAVNTLDSMIGYKNEKFRRFGAFAARLDDFCNLIPARLSSLLMLCAARLTGLDAGNAFRTFRADRYKHSSPNSAQTESVCAGALGISLSGDNYYGGELVKKPAIGIALRKAEKNDIVLANRLMYASAVLGIAGMTAVRLAILFL